MLNFTSTHSNIHQRELTAIASFTLVLIVMGPMQLSASTIADFQFDAASGAPSSLPIVVPGAGTLTVRYQNPDISPGAWIDFVLSDLDSGTSLGRLAGIVNGYSSPGAAYRGNYATGAAERTFKFSVSQGTSNGSLALVDYLASGDGPTGTDRLIIDYSPEVLTVPNSPPIVSITAGPFDAVSASGGFFAPSAGYIMLHNTSTGTHGGGFGLYVDGIGIGSTLQIPTVPEFYLVDVSAGAHLLTLTHQDDLFGDNTGIRSADAYFIPIPEPSGLVLAILAAFGLNFRRVIAKAWSPS